jgi:hypothetical protein
MAGHSDWLKNLGTSPIEPMLEFGDTALVYFTGRDLLEDQTGSIQVLWTLPELDKLLVLQRSDGSWAYPARGKSAHPTENYHILQTYRTLGILIEMFGMNQNHQAISRAADFIFSHQSEEGDIRGVFGSQYAPHYTAGLLELLIKAGYSQDPRVSKGFQWYEETRQEDGGWAWPLRTAKVSYQDAIEMEEPVKSDLSKPFSHALTGFVIRAYAAHPDYKNSPTAQAAGELLKSRFFQADKYTDRRGVEYWWKFQYPFWWGNLLTALDSLSELGFSAKDPDIRKGLEWFWENQLPTGFWPTGYGKGSRTDVNQAWVTLAVCRMLKRFFG